MRLYYWGNFPEFFWSNPSKAQQSLSSTKCWIHHCHSWSSAFKMYHLTCRRQKTLHVLASLTRNRTDWEARLPDCWNQTNVKLRAAEAEFEYKQHFFAHFLSWNIQYLPCMVWIWHRKVDVWVANSRMEEWSKQYRVSMYHYRIKGCEESKQI